MEFSLSWSLVKTKNVGLGLIFFYSGLIKCYTKEYHNYWHGLNILLFSKLRIYFFVHSIQCKENAMLLLYNVCTTDYKKLNIKLCTKNYVCYVEELLLIINISTEFHKIMTFICLIIIPSAESRACQAWHLMFKVFK